MFSEGPDIDKSLMELMTVLNQNKPLSQIDDFLCNINILTRSFSYSVSPYNKSMLKFNLIKIGFTLQSVTNLQ